MRVNIWLNCLRVEPCAGFTLNAWTLLLTIFLMAGLWSVWKGNNNYTITLIVRTISLITLNSNLRMITKKKWLQYYQEKLFRYNFSPNSPSAKDMGHSDILLMKSFKYLSYIPSPTVLYYLYRSRLKVRANIYTDELACHLFEKEMNKVHKYGKYLLILPGLHLLNWLLKKQLNDD